MRFGVILTVLLGLTLAAWLMVSIGVHAIVMAMLGVGWGGFLVLCVSGIALFAILGAAWFIIVPRQTKTRLLSFAWSRAVRECAGELLPFSQLGGIVIGARALTLRGVDGSLAFASSLVDITVEMIAQIVFVLAGLVFLMTFARRAAASALTRSVAVGLVLGLIIVALFSLFQRHGVSALERWSGRWFPKGRVWLTGLHSSLGAIHASPLRLATSLTFHLCGWAGTALWAWLALYLIGRPLSFPFVFTIEAILCAIRSLSVLIPGALGVQEASYAVIGPLFGLAPSAAVALSLLKRARDVAIGIPVLAAWQLAEGNREWQGGRGPTP